MERPFFVMNCKHSLFPIIMGISEPTYTKENLQSLNDNANKIVKYKLPSGKTVERPKYEATQDQRMQENKIRKLKLMKSQLDVLGDKTGSLEYSRKIKEQTAIYKQMSEQMGITPKMEKIRIVK